MSRTRSVLKAFWVCLSVLCSPACLSPCYFRKRPVAEVLHLHVRPKLSFVAHTYNPSTREVETEEWVLNQPRKHRELLSQKKKKKRKEKKKVPRYNDYTCNSRTLPLNYLALSFILYPCTSEAGIERVLWVQSQLRLHGELWSCLSYSETFSHIYIPWKR